MILSNYQGGNKSVVICEFFLYEECRWIGYNKLDKKDKDMLK